MANAGPGPRGQDGGAHLGASLAVHRFKNREVYTSSGRYGRVADVLVGDDGLYRALVDFGSELGKHQVPLSSFAYENGRFVVHEADIAALPTYTLGQKGLRLADAGAKVDIDGYWSGLDADESVIHVQNAAPKVSVQRPALQINLEQAPPQVTVQQPTPHVNVRQMQPVIIVRQPPPKITIEMEQPEIIVRMPDPKVNVAIADPHIEVSLQEPRVEVVQPDAPQVRITAAEPRVSLTPRAVPDVAIERTQPRVQYERTGEPQFITRQAEGGPRVRFEAMSREEALRLAGARAADLLASDLEGQKVFGSDGAEAGKIARLIVGRDNKYYAILSQDGLFGFKERKLLLAAANLAVRGDRIVVRNATAPELRMATAWDQDMRAYRPTPPDTAIRLS